MKLISFLPKTTSKPLLLAIIIITIVFMAEAWDQMDLAIANDSIFNLVLAGILSVNALFLWRLKLWAQKLAKFIISIVIILALTTIFNPFFVIDYLAEHDGQLPDWYSMLASIIPWVLVGLFCFGALDKCKSHFH